MRRGECSRLRPGPRLLSDAEATEDAIENIVGVDRTGNFPETLGHGTQFRRNEFVTLGVVGQANSGADG